MKMVGKDYGWGKASIIGPTNQACCRCGEPMPPSNGIVAAACPSCHEVGATEQMIRKVLSGESAFDVVEAVCGGRNVQEGPTD